VLLDIGTAYLVSFFDTENSEKWLTRAAEWFDNVQQFDKDLKDFELPETVRKVSQPPKNERFTDRWNNVKISKPKPGDFFNRRSCGWYWNSKRKDVVIWLGLIYYAKNDYAKAELEWKKLYEMDSYFQESEKNLYGSIPKRLLWNIKYNKGGLFATNEEIALFDDEVKRIAVLIADISLEMQNYPLAEKHYRRLLFDKTINFSRIQKSYITYALGVALLSQFKSDESLRLFIQFAPNQVFAGTPSAPRALLTYANYQTQSKYDTISCSKGIACYRYLANNYPNTEQGEYALYYLAETLDFIGNPQSASEVMNEYIRKYVNGVFYKHAYKFLQNPKGGNSK
jgi:tetratricopeptide (TPR) repeat protein